MLGFAEGQKVHGAWPGDAWHLSSKHHLAQQGARVSAADMQRSTGLLLVAFTSGIFHLYQMPACQLLQTLSVTRHCLSAAVLNGALLNN